MRPTTGQRNFVWSGDFDVEWENDAEIMLAGIEFHSKDSAEEIGDTSFPIFAVQPAYMTHRCGL